MYSKNEDKQEATQVRICGRDYSISTDKWEPMYVQKLADLLDRELKRLEAETRIVDNYKLLILAGLKLIDRNIQLEKNKNGSSRLVEEEIQKLNSQIENIV